MPEKNCESRLGAVKPYKDFLWSQGNVPTPEMCLAAVQQNGLVLKHVPECFRTPLLCLVAVEKDSYALEYVPEHVITPEMCLLAVTQD